MFILREKRLSFPIKYTCLVPICLIQILKAANSFKCLKSRSRIWPYIMYCFQCDQIVRVLKVPWKSSPNIKQHFRLLWKMAFFVLNYCGYFLGNIWRKLGYFLLKHLVTLLVVDVIKLFLQQSRFPKN